MSASAATLADRGKALLWWTILLGVFLLPYAQVSWWSFPLSTLAFGLLFLLRWGREAWRRAGLPRKLGTVAACLLAFLLLALVFDRLVLPMLTLGYVLQRWPFTTVAAFPFQALNEEIFLGYLLLTALVRRTGRPVLVAVGVALLFAFLHHALYRYGALGESLAWMTVATLTAVGALRNALILVPRHVGWAWALHAAWNVTMFGGRWVPSPSDGGKDALTEPQVMDLLLGRPPVLGVTAAAAAVAAGALAAVSRRTRLGPTR